MVDVDAFLGGLLNDEGWQEALGDDVAAVIQCLEGRYAAGSQISSRQADEIQAILHSGASLEQILARLQAVPA
jgi:hypothetical protein